MYSTGENTISRDEWSQPLEYDVALKEFQQIEQRQ